MTDYPYSIQAHTPPFDTVSNTGTVEVQGELPLGDILLDDDIEINLVDFPDNVRLDYKYSEDPNEVTFPVNFLISFSLHSRISF